MSGSCQNYTNRQTLVVRKRGAGNLACSRLSGGFSDHVPVSAPSKGRLKAAQRAPRSHDWLPHKTPP
jgi:hypothetical protein